MIRITKPEELTACRVRTVLVSEAQGAIIEVVSYGIWTNGLSADGKVKWSGNGQTPAEILDTFGPLLVAWTSDTPPTPEHEAAASPRARWRLW